MPKKRMGRGSGEGRRPPRGNAQAAKIFLELKAKHLRKGEEFAQKLESARQREHAARGIEKKVALAKTLEILGEMKSNALSAIGEMENFNLRHGAKLTPKQATNKNLHVTQVLGHLFFLQQMIKTRESELAELTAKLN
ncbi:MAG: hypothetical protein NUV67_05065 [archaeon]|nr:hypothetical protein [archaeon]